MGFRVKGLWSRFRFSCIDMLQKVNNIPSADWLMPEKKGEGETNWFM